MSIILIILLTVVFIEVSYLVYRSGVSLRPSSRKGVLLDTSALMDGRVVTAAQTGFMPSHLIVPRSVIHELQLLADQADPEKRSRARRGLDAVQELQAITYMKVETPDDGEVGSGGVDERLIDLAKASHASICTIDFNLNKAATAMGLRVLNINELAGSIRMAFLPGESISLALTQKGQSNAQAVGYLADGTMVVVDKASSKIGQTVEIEFIRSLQTAAGRMMFAKLANGHTEQTESDSKSKSRAAAGGRKITSHRSSSTPSNGSNEAKDLRSKAEPADVKTKANSRGGGRRQSKQRKTNEDSLIELLNQQ